MEEHTMHILIPLDGSPLAERAIEPAIKLLRGGPEPRRLTLMQIVIDPTVTLAISPQYSYVYDTNRLESQLMLGQEYLKGMASRPMFDGIEIGSSVEVGDPSEEIARKAKAAKTDFIVMTSHGRSGLAHLALGSVAEAVARNAGIPTLIVRSQGETFPNANRQNVPTVLVPLDGSLLAETALDPAVTIAQALHGTILLLRVLPVSSSLPDAEESNREASGYLATIRRRYEAKVIVQTEVVWGEPSEQIAVAAAQHRLDLVVLATHARVGLDRFLNGSVTEHVLHRVSGPVLILHPLD